MRWRKGERYELCFVGYEFPLYCVDVPFLLFCNHGTLTSCISVFHDGNKFAQGWWGAFHLDFLFRSEGIAYESEFAGCRMNVHHVVKVDQVRASHECEVAFPYFGCLLLNHACHFGALVTHGFYHVSVGEVDVAVVAVGFYIHNVVEWDIINFIEVFDNQLLWCVH